MCFSEVENKTLCFEVPAWVCGGMESESRSFTPLPKCFHLVTWKSWVPLKRLGSGVSRTTGKERTQEADAELQTIGRMGNKVRTPLSPIEDQIIPTSPASLCTYYWGRWGRESAACIPNVQPRGAGKWNPCCMVGERPGKIVSMEDPWRSQTQGLHLRPDKVRLEVPE